MPVDWISLVAEHDAAAARGLEPEQHLGEGRLAAAGLADDGQRLGLARLEADRLVGLDHAAFAAAENLVGGDLVVLLQVVDLTAPVAPGSIAALRSCAPAGGAAQSISLKRRQRLAWLSCAGDRDHRDVGGVAEALRRNSRSAGRNCSPSGARAAAATGREWRSADRAFLSAPGSGIERNRPCV